MVFLKNYFHPNQQMPTTSGFRGDFFLYQQLSFVDSDLLHFISHFSVFSILQVSKFDLCINQHPLRTSRFS